MNQLLNMIPDTAQFRKAGIYKFTNKMNGKVYVGQAQNIYKRYLAHCRLHSNYRFGRALKKYGVENFEFGVLEVIDDLTQLDEREQYYLDFYQSYVSDKGYNVAVIANNPTKGRKRKKWETASGLAALKRLNKEGKHPWLGRKHAESAKKLLSDARKGKPVSPQTIEAKIKAKRRSVHQINIETGEVIRVWTHIRAIADELGFSYPSLCNACNGGRYSKQVTQIQYEGGIYKGYRWIYADGKKINLTFRSKEYVEARRKKIAQIDMETNEIVRVWSSIGEIIGELGFGRNGIKYACRGQRWDSEAKRYFPKTTHAGYKWEYV